MAVKNFVFRQNWVGRKVTGMKKTFFAIFNPTWTQIVLPKSPNKEFLNSILVKRGTIILPILWL